MAKVWGGKGHKQKGAALGQAATVARDKIITTKIGQTTLLPYQRLPSTILREYCQKQKHKPQPIYKPMKRAGKFQYQLTIPAANNKQDDLRFLPATAVPNDEQAREEAALLALLHFTPALPHERKFPEPYRTTWLQALQVKKDADKSSAGTRNKSAAKDTSDAASLGASTVKTNTSSTSSSNGATSTTAQASSGLRSAVAVNRSMAQTNRQQAQAARNARIAKHEAIRLANRPHPVFMSAQLRKAITRVLQGGQDEAQIPENADTNQESDDEKDETFYLDSMQSDVQDYVEERLHAEGFTRKQARQAFSRITLESSAEREWEHMYEQALQWLLVHVDEQDLPPSFDPRGRTLDVVVAAKPNRRMALEVSPDIQQFARIHGLSNNDASLLYKEHPSEKEAEEALWKAAIQLAQGTQPPSIDDESSADPSLVEDELEALAAIFAQDCKISRSSECNTVIELDLPLDGVFRLKIILDSVSYPSSWPLQVVVVSRAAENTWTQGISVLVEAIKFLSKDAVLGEPMIFALHGRVMELLQGLDDLPPVSLKESSTSPVQNERQATLSSDELSAPKVKPKHALPQKRPRERAPFWSLPPDETPIAIPFPPGALKKARAVLPAAQARSDFLRALKCADEGSHVLLCTGETGCG